jgi:uncharacterized protein YceH (UPF0502 family)
MVRPTHHRPQALRLGRRIGSTADADCVILTGMDAESNNPLGPLLTAEESRVLGCLVEKSYTTPDYYPMTVNALVNACNQRSSRFPVVDYSEDAVRDALDGLRDKGWAILVRTAGARTIKYKHHLRHHFNFTDHEVALLCVLMLRGPQTVGELRGRTERIAAFGELSEVEQTLRELASGYPVPLVRELPRQAGRKDHRFAQLLSEEADEEPAEPEPGPRSPSASAGRIDSLEEEVHTLRDQVLELQRQFEAFQRQFE